MSNSYRDSDNLRLPDWRHREAVRYVQSPGQRGKFPCDEFIGLAKRFYLNLDTVSTTADRDRLYRKMPAMSSAHTVWESGAGGIRDLVETRVLASYPPELIAEFNGISSACVHIFERVFFDVRGRRSCPDFILQHAIGAPGGTTDHSSQYWRAIKMLSWLGGPFVADELLCHGRSIGMAESPERVAKNLTDRSQDIVATTAAIALANQSGDERWQKEVARLIAASEYKDRPERVDAAHRGYMDNVKAFLGNIKLVVGSKGIPDEMNKYCKGPIEPRADEWAKISRGEPVPELDQRIEQYADVRQREKCSVESPSS